MTDKEKTELLHSVLEALLGYKLAGSYVVEVKLTTTVDADNVKDAEAKGLEYAKEHMDEMKAWAIKVTGIDDENTGVTV